MKNKNFPRKILYSPGYGAGWSTWFRGEIEDFKQQLIEDKILIKLVEDDLEKNNNKEKFLERVREIIGPTFNMPYNGGLEDIKVGTVNGPYRINEYDGFESIEEVGSMDFFL